ncbi:MAG: hypothetical protein KTR18_15890 [Acidiferrobacterales bacterium]|nr:hypothetical protein [Acidiferrobacterales bacterium]
MALRVSLKRKLVALSLPSLIAFIPVHAGEITMSNIGISNEVTEFRVQAEVGAMDVETAKAKLAAQLEETKSSIRRQFCDQPPEIELCAVIPNDNTDFSELFVYMFIMAAAQNSFDIFSWQSFVAMNWPLMKSGDLAETQIGTMPDAARVWSTFKTPREIFSPDYIDPICGEVSGDQGPVVHATSFKQAGGLPLIDRNQNYVVYDLRINDMMANYILANGLDSVEGQLQFAEAGNKIDFPLGFYDDPVKKLGGKEGSAAVKLAWKIMDVGNGDNPSRYFTTPGKIAVPARDSESGKAFCIDAVLGLVGMHIMQRTQSGNGREWTWSTFEHVDNAPFAQNSRKPVDTLHEELFPNGCLADPADQFRYAFYNADCPDCETNSLESADWKWSRTMPYAAAAKVSATQVVRCWQIFEGTELVNQLWQEKLQGTVWANYESSSAQWKGAKKSMLFPHGEVPRFLVNSTMETYSQYGENSSCIGCHASARTAAGQESNFSFILGLAARYENESNEAKVSMK